MSTLFLAQLREEKMVTTKVRVKVAVYQHFDKSVDDVNELREESKAQWWGEAHLKSIWRERYKQVSYTREAQLGLYIRSRSSEGHRQQDRGKVI